MKRFLNTLFVFMTLTALVLSAFGVSPAYAAALDVTRPQVLTFGIDEASVTINDADKKVSIDTFSASDDTAVTHWMITATSGEPHPSEAGWTAGTGPTLPLLYDLPSEQGEYALYPWVKDAAGNVSAFYYGTPATFTVDNAPTATVSADLGLYTNTAPILFTVEFSEPVKGFRPVGGGSGDLTLVNGDLVNGSFVALSTTEYTFEIDPIAEGTVSVTVAAGAAEDDDGAPDTPNGASAPATVLYDTTKPTVNTFTAPAAATGNSVTFTAFTANLDASDICGYMVTGVTTETTPIEPAVPAADDEAWVSPAPASWSAPAADDYTLYPWLLDCAGNVSNKVTGVNVTGFTGPTVVDPTIPSVVLTTDAGSHINGSVTVTATFSEDVTGFGDASADFTITGTGSAVSNIVPISGPENVYTFDFNPGTVEGAVSVTVAANAATDGTNLNTASNTLNFTYDKTAPLVDSIERYNPVGPTAIEQHIQFKVVFSEAVAMDEDAIWNNALLVTTNVQGAGIWANDENGDGDYTDLNEFPAVDCGTPAGGKVSCIVNVSTGYGNGTIRLDIPTNGVTDKAGNEVANAPYTIGQSYIINKGAAPTAPTLLSPANNALVTTQPTLDWANSTQVVKLASSDEWYYEIQMTATTPLWTWTMTYRTEGATGDPIAGLGDSKYIFEGDEYLPSNAIIIWKVRAYNDKGQFSAWSKTRTLRTKMYAPMLLSPANGKLMDTTSPEFTWSPVAGATSYTIQIRNEDANKVVKTATVKAPTYTYTALNLAVGTTYSWGVKANGKNPSNWNSGWRFKTPATQPPATPVLSLPANNALVSVSDEQALTWKQVVAVVGKTPAAHHYEIQVSLDNAFVQNLYTGVVDGNLPDATVTGGVVTMTIETAPGRTYYWRVRAWTAGPAALHGPWSKVNAFKVKFTAPWAVSPADGETVASVNPTLQWESENGLWLSYTLQIGTDDKVTQNVKTYTIPATSVDASKALVSYTIPVGVKTTLSPATTYYWRVKINGLYVPIFSLTLPKGAYPSFKTP